MTRRRKALLVAALLLVALCAAGAGGTWFLLGTDRGARWVFTRVGALLPGALEVGEVRGPLRGPLEIRDVVFHSDSADVRIRVVRLRWQLRELLRRRLDVESLTAEDVTIVRGLPRPLQEAKQGPLPDVHFSVNIAVHDALVKNVVVTGPAGDEQLRIDTLALQSAARGDTLRVERLSARGPRFSLDASGWLRPQGDYPVDLQGRWAMRPQDLPPLAGRARLSGSFEQLRVEHTLEAPFASRADLVLHRPMRDLAFEGTVSARGVRPRLFRPDLPEMTVDAAARVEGTPAQFDAKGDGRLVSPEYGTLTARFDVTRRDTEVRLARVDLGIPGTPARAVARGLVVVGEAFRFEIAADWTNVAWPLTGPATVRSAKGRGTVAGTPQGYDFSAAADVSGPLIPAGSWRARGRGNTTSADLARVEGTILRAGVTGGGRVTWSPFVTWEVAFDARGVDPSAMVANVPGSLRVTGRTKGRMEEAGPDLEVSPLAAEGTLRGAPLSAKGRVAYRHTTATLHDVEGTWGGARFGVAGTAGDRLDLAWRADVPDLALLLDGLSGSARGEGRLRGTTAAPHVVATLAADDVAHPQGSAARVDARVDADLAAGGRLDAEIGARGPVLAGVALERATLAVRGTTERHVARLTVAAPDQSLDAELDGGAVVDGAASSWTGRLRALALHDPRAGRWSLVQPARVAFSATGASAETVCLGAGEARLCASGSWTSGDGWIADATLARLGLDRARPYLPDGVTLAGALAGRAEARADAAGRLTARVELRPGDGTVTYPGPGETPETVRFTGAAADIDVGERGTTARGGFEIPAVGTARVEAQLAGFRALGMPPEATPLSGRLSAHFGDLSFARAFVPGVTRVLGRVDAEVRVAGTVGAPRVDGDARLVDFGADVPAAGLELRGGTITAQSKGGAALVVDGRIRSGPGRLTLNGSIPPAPTRENPLRLVLEGEDFLAVAREDARVLVSPDVTIEHAGNLLVVRGTVRVPEAAIVVNELPGGAVPVSQDVVFVDREARVQEKEPPVAVDARVRLILGDEISFKAFGFDGKPVGELLLVDQPNRPPEAIGEIRLERGTFKAYGQDLTIMNAALRFAGPPTNPGLDVRAFRRATANPEIVAGVRVTGFAQDPEVSLWSDPPMPETDQLAYLVLGRPLDEAGASEGSLLANAAGSLGVRGGNLLARSIGARFGLEEARIETKGGSYQEASLFVGKYLSPRLYVAYGVGIFRPSNTFRLRYALGRKWTLQAETGEGTGADLLYSPEAQPINRNLQEPAAIGDVPRVPDTEGTGGTR